MGHSHSNTASSVTHADTAAANNFDVNSYLGTWYEIGRFPLQWENLCVFSTAEYKAGAEKGSIQVTNTCKMQDGTSFSRTGLATPTASDASGRKFVLTFTDKLPSDGPAPYWVLDTDYQTYAIVGNGDKKTHAWILSRTPAMSQCLANVLAEKLHTDFGYNMQGFVWHQGLLTPCVKHQ